MLSHGNVPLPHDTTHVSCSAFCFSCDKSELDPTPDSPLSKSLSFIKNSASAQVKETAAIIEEGRPKPCPHFVSPSVCTVENPSFEGKCMAEDCDLTSNLWFCLTCCQLNCGRSQAFSTGHNHGINHFERTNHPVVVKAGTVGVRDNGMISGEGFCYICQDTVEIPDLRNIISKLGIKLPSVGEKTTLEMNASININFDVSELEGDLTPIDGLIDQSFLIGMENGGNNCYINSLLQCLKFSPNFQNLPLDHIDKCNGDPVSCLECQTVRIFEGLQKSPILNPSNKFEPINSPTPFLFKKCVANDNANWLSMQQQDISEYLSFLIDRYTSSSSEFLQSLGSSLSFKIRNNLTCFNCQCSSITVENNSGSLTLQLPKEVAQNAPESGQEEHSLNVKLIDLMTNWAEEVIQFRCSQCKSRQTGLLSRSFLTYPDTLFVTINRFTFREGRAIKLGINLETSGIDFTKFAAKPIENPLMEAAETPVNEEGLAMLLSLGISEPHARKALTECQNDVERAAEWAFMNEETQSSTNVDPKLNELVSVLGSMGYSKDQAIAAGVSISNPDDIGAALDWLGSHSGEDVARVLERHNQSENEMKDLAEKAKSADVEGKSMNLSAVASHKGSSPCTGHYICHGYSEKHGKWVLFNDLKVGVVENPVFSQGYLYMFQ
ncbi:hypothetical protein P9112_006682 [Eukaryota sp. TZLM1-RC]